MAKCGMKTEVYTRVCGYHRPVRNWNRGKQEEFKERKTYNPDFQKKTEKIA
ncbi:MAG TPA: anaerobic ribonucleoside-triphosphate reductase [Victivallales bacterium]|nr:anaerobic ribonucleoside-triphosphate reductase [Victivallales bacterium]HPO89933.1 anaerobic ribonucleoside-triphosphate reductase [Victivallales bacterium]HRR05745.1 anaerobic ribonucleoside-triphosphate reductase [Victivallales bacterium]HRR28678.1 anaerobic ribonucleoside-triphosphate reductase [Victivallales bacterium]